MPGARNQLGVALLAGLVLLAAISLLALVATSSMILQQRMAGNFSDSQRARQAAGVAVSQGAAFLFHIVEDGRKPGCLLDCFVPPLDTIIRPASELPAHPEFEDASWWHAWATEAGIDPASGNRVSGPWNFHSLPPRFLIEELYFDTPESAARPADAPPLDGIGYYRILGRGVGLGPAAVAVDEAIMARPWLDKSSPGSDGVINGDFCASFRDWYDCGLLAWRQRR